jgi:hypothetical protein
MEISLPQTLSLILSLQDVHSFRSQLPKVSESVKFLFCLTQIGSASLPACHSAALIFKSYSQLARNS